MKEKLYNKMITPYLMGQYREGLCRVKNLARDRWEILDLPSFRDQKIESSDTKIERMGEIYFQLSQRVCTAVRSGAVPVSIAGDCVSAIGVLAGLQKAGKQPDRIIWLDAHGDFHTWETTQTQYIGGMPLAMLVGRGDQRIVSAVGLVPYAESSIVLSDARDLDSGEREALVESNIVVCRPDSIIESISQTETVYLHWDTDFLTAPEEMPALKYHVDSGSSLQKLRILFQSFKSLNIVAVSVSAWHADRDTEDKTAVACLELLRELGIDIEINK